MGRGLSTSLPCRYLHIVGGSIGIWYLVGRSSRISITQQKNVVPLADNHNTMRIRKPSLIWFFLALAACCIYLNLYVCFSWHSSLSTNLGYICSNIGNDSSNSRNVHNRNQSNIPSSVNVPPGSTFPHILHYTWSNKDLSFAKDNATATTVKQKEQKKIEQRIQTIRQNNPGWEIRVWTDDECINLIHKHKYFSDFYERYKDELNPRKLWDVARIVILYVHGGIYLDHDVTCEMGVSFQGWLAADEEDTDVDSNAVVMQETATGTAELLLVDPLHRKLGRDSTVFTAGNYFMESVPGHPFWLHYMQNIELGMYKDLWVLDHTGPRQLAPTIHGYIYSNNDNTTEAVWDNFQGDTYCHAYVGR